MKRSSRFAKILVSFTVSILVCVGVLAGIAFYMVSPALGPDTLPKSAILSFPTIEQPIPFKPPEKLTIMTYNIGYASGEKNNLGAVLNQTEVMANLDMMVDALSELNVDVLCLQEVDFHAARSFDINQMEYLATRLKMPYAAYVINWNKRYVAWPYWPPAKHFGRIVAGQAILSRYPLIQHEAIYFEKPQSNSFIYNLAYLDRVAQHVTVRIGDQEIGLWNVHLEAFDSETRLQQIRRLAEEALQDKYRAVLVTGDFNSVSYFKPDLSSTEKEELEDSGEGVHRFIKETQFSNAESLPVPLSFPSWDPVKKIDHIFYKGLTMKKSGNVRDLSASDHLPVWGGI